MEENDAPKPEENEPIEPEMEKPAEPEPPRQVQTVQAPLRTGLGYAPWLISILAASPVLFLLAWRAQEPWLAPFLGRLHPLVIHFPIGLLLFVALLEVFSMLSFGRFRARTRLALLVGAAGAVAAAALGILLRDADGVEGELVQWHFIGGLVVAATSLLAVFFRFARGYVVERLWRGWYRVFLVLSCASLVVTSHFGASMTHGEDYLTEYAPWWTSESRIARKAVFPSDLPVGEWQVYDHAVAQIFNVRCGSCHNARNKKGGLVLDTWVGMEAGGKHGPVLEPGDVAGSEMIERLLLPIEDEDHMPPKKKPQPSELEIDLLTLWIEAGAPQFATVASIDPDGELMEMVEALPASLEVAQAAAPKEIDQDAVEEARKKGAAILRKLKEDYPGVVGYESRQSADLHLNATVMGSRFGDDDLERFSSLAGNIVWLDLTGTGISDRSARTLAKMTRLRTLRLGETDIGDETVAALADLGNLESLSLYRTRVTADSWEILEQLSSLENLYTNETALEESQPVGPE